MIDKITNKVIFEIWRKFITIVISIIIIIEIFVIIIIFTLIIIIILITIIIIVIITIVISRWRVTNNSYWKI